MKRILFIFSLLLTSLLVSSHLFASTNVGSVLSADAQWDQNGSPYIIQSRVLIPPGVTLKIGPGVQVVFQGPATLQISGELKVNGSAAAPAVINMTDGGLRSALFIDGGEAQLSNMKVLSGVFLAQDASIRMDACEVTKGSGLYLKGNTIAHLKNNKFYGNATGVVLDGTVEANMQFNTLVQNTYGVYLKDFSKLVFVNNSVHDNDSEVVNNGSKAKLGGNYWGTLSPQTVKDKIKGTVSISPMKDLKDILRAYLRSELPVITQSMSDEAEAEDNQADRAARQALKEFRKKQRQGDIRMMEAQNGKSAMIPAAIQPSPTIFVPAATATIAPMFDLSAQPAASMPPAEPSNSSSGMPGSGALSGSSLPAPPAMSGALVSPNSSLPAPPDLMNSMPMPPSLPSTASEPPALGNLAAAVTPSTILSGLGVAPVSSEVQPPAAGAPASPSVSLPAPPDLTSNTASSSLPSIASQPPVLNNLPPVSTPTPGLGGGSVSTDDLASIVATAQAASTAATPVESPSPTVITVPAISLPDSSSNPGSVSTPAVDQSSSALQTSLPPAVGDTSTFTSTPIVISTDTFTSTPTYTSTDTAVDTSTSTSTPTFTYTFTSTPIAVMSTPTPLPAMAPPPPPPVSAASPVSAAPPPPPVDSSSMAAGSLVPIAPKDSVPPPPDFGDDSSASGVKPPVIIPDANSPAPLVAPPPPPQPTTPPADLDVDGMQAPPMDSGLDYANPKK